VNGKTPKRLNRVPLTVAIPMDQIMCREDLESDPIYVKKYLQFTRGQKHSLLSRVPLESVLNGFYRRQGNGFEFIEDSVDRDSVDYTKEEIRSGHRPALYTYKNINMACDKMLVAPDDNHAYLAYQELGVQSVPVVILETTCRLCTKSRETQSPPFER
jgi:hypothetical protein